jgi:dihydrolipoamide dehydrogenase
MSNEYDVVVLGSGPGGYAAAFRAADLGLKTALIERYSVLGGVCLNVGCIPSKALLHAAEVLDEARHAENMGISFGAPKIDLAKLEGYKSKVVKQLTGGLAMLAKQRKVTVIQGTASFENDHAFSVQKPDGKAESVAFKHAVIACGSSPIKLPFMPEDPRVIDSTGALELKDVPKKLLVIGGGIIGLEMATIYANLGSEVTIVEMSDQIASGADKDLVAPLAKRMAGLCKDILLETSVTSAKAEKAGITVNFEGKMAPAKAENFDKVLVAVGRSSNGGQISADKAGVQLAERNFINVDNQMRTNVPHIFAIGDVVGNPMLAHKAAYEGRLAAEVISGLKHYNQAKVIPAVAYTNPEIAWVGKTERECKEEGITYEKGAFPWMASGRAIGSDRTEGLTKILVDENHRVIGAGIVGINAGELIGELALAIEMGCDIEDIALTIHAHPTLSESIMLASEMIEGTITDLYVPKKKK